MNDSLVNLSAQKVVIHPAASAEKSYTITARPRAPTRHSTPAHVGRLISLPLPHDTRAAAVVGQLPPARWRRRLRFVCKAQGYVQLLQQRVPELTVILQHHPQPPNLQHTKAASHSSQRSERKRCCTKD